MIQQVSDDFWQAEARSEETKEFIRDIEHLTRRKLTAEEQICIVLGYFCRGIVLSEISADGKTFIPALASGR